MQGIEFETTGEVDAAELAEFYARQGRCSAPQADRLRRMIDGSLCFVAARADGRLIGLARGVTDGVTGLLAECKLDRRFQGPAAITGIEGRIEHDEQGIAGRMAELVIEALRDYGVERIDVSAYGTEVDFCEELGFRKMGGMVSLSMNVEAEVCVAQAADSE